MPLVSRVAVSSSAVGVRSRVLKISATNDPATIPRPMSSGKLITGAAVPRNDTEVPPAAIDITQGRILLLIHGPDSVRMATIAVSALLPNDASGPVRLIAVINSSDVASRVMRSPTSADRTPFSKSTTAILLDWLAATRK